MNFLIQWLHFTCHLRLRGLKWKFSSFSSNHSFFFCSHITHAFPHDFQSSFALPSIHLFPKLRNQKTSLYSKLLMHFFDVPLLCFYIFGKHTFTCASTSPIFICTHFLCISFLCTFALDANFTFFDARAHRRLIDSEMVIRFGLVGCVLF